jgi:protein-S-isoprenylcysteine O-methyltransferase Ste14
MDKTGGWRWANVPLPEAHLVGLGAGFLVQLIAPWKLSWASWVGHAFGWPLLLAGLWLAVSAVRAAADVNLERPSQLVRSGPYAFSRNPMYVAWALVYPGIASVANAAWPLLLLPVVLLVTHIQVFGRSAFWNASSAMPTGPTKHRSADTFEKRTSLTTRPWSAEIDSMFGLVVE